MKFLDYAAIHLKTTLKPFQIQTLHAYYNKKGTLVVAQATGFGKPAYFRVPAVMLEEHQYGLVIVPSLALGEGHHLNLQNLEVLSFFLNTTNSKEELRFEKLILFKIDPIQLSLLGHQKRQGKTSKRKI